MTLYDLLCSTIVLFSYMQFNLFGYFTLASYIKLNVLKGY